MLGKLVASFIVLSQGVNSFSYVGAYDPGNGGCAVKEMRVTGLTDMDYCIDGLRWEPPIPRFFACPSCS